MKKYFVIFFFAFLIAVPSIDRFCLKNNIAFLGRPFSEQPPTFLWKDLRSGELSPKLELWATNTSQFARTIGSLYNEITFTWLGRTLPHIWLGKEHWIFLPETTRVFPQQSYKEAAQNIQQRIIELHKILKQKNIPLYVSFIPSRTRLYADKIFPKPELPTGPKTFLKDLEQAAEDSGSHLISLEKTLTELRSKNIPVYYKHDHHWTFKAAEAAAQKSAELLFPHAPSKNIFPVLWHPASDPNPIVAGSHLKKMGFRINSPLNHEFEDPQPWAEFKETKEVKECGVYLSTSFNLFGTHRFLSNFLGCKVTDISGIGKGALWPAQQFIEKLRLGQVQKSIRFVVWEIPEYQCLDGDGNPESHFSIPLTSSPNSL